MKCKCGSELFEECTKVNGWWKVLINGDGNIMETSLDSLAHGNHPKTVACVECGKRHLNPLAQQIGDNNEKTK